MKVKSLKPIFKIHKNKQNVDKWILENFPDKYENMCYVEPFSGGANLLFLKERSLTEVINDQDDSLLKIYMCLRDEPKEFIKRLNHYKYCEETFEKIKKKNDQEDYLDQSISEYILRKMSVSEAKNKFSKTGLSQWKKSIQELYELSYRLQEVFILNKKPIDVIDIFNSKNSLLYCTPPFLYENKNTKKVYSSDMEPDEHIKLSHYLNNFKGKVVLNGMTSPLYNRLYKNWNMIRSKIKKKGEKTSVIWCNF